MRHLNLISRLCSEPWAIEPSALQALAEKTRGYLSGRIAAPVPQVIARADTVGPVDWNGDPMIPQMEVIKGIGIIRVSGALARGIGWIDALFGVYDYDWLSTFLAEAIMDDDVESIVIAIDSPGGSHLGLEEATALVTATAAVKSTFVFSAGYCCSAAYALAVEAAQIVAAPSAMIGCLGSKLRVLDSSGAYANEGLRAEYFTSGAEGQELPLKAMMEEGKPITEAERDFYRATTQYCGKWVARVTERRPQAKGVSFEGGWVFGRQALLDGLVDAIWPSLETMVAALIGSESEQARSGGRLV